MTTLSDAIAKASVTESDQLQERVTKTAGLIGLALQRLLSEIDTADLTTIEGHSRAVKAVETIERVATTLGVNFDKADDFVFAAPDPGPKPADPPAEKKRDKVPDTAKTDDPPTPEPTKGKGLRGKFSSWTSK